MPDTPAPSPPAPPAGPLADPAESERAAGRRWHRNLLVLGVLLPLWFVGSFGCGIFFVDELNDTLIGEAPLGFWFAHQGSIYLFVLLILVYALWMDRIEPVAPKHRPGAPTASADGGVNAPESEGEHP